MTTPSSIGIGVVGLGFMGRIHTQAYLAAQRDGLPCTFRAVADPNPERRAGNPPAVGNLGGPAPERLFDPAHVRGYATPEELFADPAIHLVSICTYTDSHIDLSLKALAAGKHVLLEKPVALRSTDVQTLADAARRASTICMPAMCMRFWPGWDWLKARIDDQSFGKVRSAVFQRLGSGPNWSADFYRNAARSGGALFDLHIHDADFIYWCFGTPSSVTSTGSLLHQTTLYRFSDPDLHVTAEAAWDLVPAAGFRMRYTVCFEHATAEFDISRSPTVTLHTRDKSESIELPTHAGYDGEIRHLINTIASGTRKTDATLDDAVAVTRILEAEAQSIRTRQHVSIA